MERKDGITLFDNREQRGQDDRKPLMKGFVTLTHDGVQVEYEVALWPKESKKTGKRFWGGTIKERVEKPQHAPRPQNEQFDSDIPF